MRVDEYGGPGPVVVVLHGGPAAVGEAAPIARGLADPFHVLEPWQRGSGGQPLTVARHIADLDELLLERCAGTRPALIGESWGAMLALAYAAEHPARIGPLVLVGCGTFDPLARARMHTILEERTDENLQRRLDQLTEEFPDPHEPEEEISEAFDIRAHTETWQDMLRLQAEGLYPRAFTAINSPVLMLHGADDPHPGRLIRTSLRAHLAQLEYREFARCGHSPWRERNARDEFFVVMRTWLAESMMTAR